MSTRIKKAFKLYQEKIKAEEPFTMGEVLLEAGYAESTSRAPSHITESQTWRKLLDRYPDDLILDAVYRDALGQGRDANENRKIFLKMKGRLKDSVSLDVNKERLGLFQEEEEDNEEA
jgi:hypothetical protein